MLIPERKGKTLTINYEPDNNNLFQYLIPLTYLLNRRFKPLNSIAIETINKENAAQSPYSGAFEIIFDAVKDFNKLFLYRKMM